MSLEKLTVGVVADPAKSLANKTGAWRNQRPIFIHENCIGCRACEMCCPEGCISGDAKTKMFDSDLDYCKGCGMCANECPADPKAIEMVVEEK
ncbi:MAG: 4Fe-4S binding protein [Phycisphaerae bacterium]|jgi:pyruvate ferredoxin oxidoreductase delta subunit|nr:4Fe-4S binding protein [Phycisphaerae bacterium]